MTWGSPAWVYGYQALLARQSGIASQGGCVRSWDIWIHEVQKSWRQGNGCMVMNLHVYYTKRLDFFNSYLLKLFNGLLLKSNLYCLICYLLQETIFQGSVSFCRYSSWVQPILGRVFHWHWNTEFKKCLTKPSCGRSSCRVRGKLLILIGIWFFSVKSLVTKKGPNPRIWQEHSKSNRQIFFNPN